MQQIGNPSPLDLKLRDSPPVEGNLGLSAVSTPIADNLRRLKPRKQPSHGRGDPKLQVLVCPALFFGALDFRSGSRCRSIRGSG